MNLSIIIPTLNEAQYIRRLIDRLLTNNENVPEIILVDGGSTDGTIDLLPSKRVTVIQTVASRAIQMNAGAKIAKNDYLYFVHADTLPPKGYQQDLKAIMDSPYKAACYRSKYIGNQKILRLNAFFTRFNWLVCRGGDQSLLIDKNYFNELGGYDEQMEIMEEYPLIEKLMADNSLKIIPKHIEIGTRKYDSNSWLKVSRANYKAFKMYRKGCSTKEIKEVYLCTLD